MCKAKEILSSIEQNISGGLVKKAFFEKLNDRHEEIATKVDNTSYANLHNQICNAMQADFLLCVTRVWDKSPDARSFPDLLKVIDWEALKVTLKGDRNEAARTEAVHEFQSQVCEFQESDACRALLISRAEGVAHDVGTSRERKKMENPRPANFRELYDALDLSVKVYNFGTLALFSEQTNFGVFEREFGCLVGQYIENLPNLGS